MPCSLLAPVSIKLLSKHASTCTPPTPDPTQRRTAPLQMNLADSERMAGALEAAGYESTGEVGDASVLVYNTCSIRERAEVKVYSALGHQAARKRKQMRDLKIVVAGCVAQQEGEALLRRVPEVDVVMGPQFANKLHELLERVDADGSQVGGGHS